jgi:hypothetical protein
MTDQGEFDDVRDPVTGQLIEDPVLRLAVREGHFRIRNGKTQIHWAGLMRGRRPEGKFPEYIPMTEEQAGFLHQLSEETFITVRQVSNMLCYRTLEAGIRFLTNRKVPIYRIGRKYVVLSGDVIRAIESCRVDTAADWGLWSRYFQRSYAWRDRKERRE